MQKISSLFIISLLLCACGDGGSSNKFDKVIEIKGNSYCNAVYKTFYETLDGHLTRSPADAPELYRSSLRYTIYLNIHDVKTRSKMMEAVSNDKDLKDTELIRNRLESCEDLVKIHTAMLKEKSKNPEFQGDINDDSGIPDNRKVMMSFMEGFANFLDFNSDFEAATYKRPSQRPESSERETQRYDYGVRFETLAEEVYQQQQASHLKVAALRDENAGLEIGDEIENIYFQKNYSFRFSRAALREKYGQVIRRTGSVPAKDLFLGEIKALFSSNDLSEMEMDIIREKEDGSKVAIKGLKLKGINLKSESYDAPSVSSSLKGDIIYVRIFEFVDGVAAQVAEAIAKHKLSWLERNAATGKKLDSQKDLGILLDLRFNGGGSLDEEMGVAGIFLPFQEIQTRQAKTGNPVIMFVKPNSLVHENPLIVLINHRSASASEGLASSLQDTGRALIAGERSFGKGIGQSPVTIQVGDDFMGKMMLTDFYFYPPSGKNFQGLGIVPDIEGVVDSKHLQMRAELEQKCEKGETNGSWKACVLRMENYKTQKDISWEGRFVDKSPTLGKALSCHVNNLDWKAKTLESISKSKLARKEAPISSPIASAPSGTLGSAPTSSSLVKIDEATTQASEILVEMLSSKRFINPQRAANP